MLSSIQQQTTRETGIKKFCTHRSWGKYTMCFEGLQKEVKAGSRQREAGARHGPF